MENPANKETVIILWDVESTGLDVENAAIISLSACHTNVNTGKFYSFDKYIHTDQAIPEAAADIHGIHQEDLEGKDPFPVVFRQFMDFVETVRKEYNVSVVRMMSHNGSHFDDLIFNKHCLKFKLKKAACMQSCDSYAALRAVLPRAYKCSLHELHSHIFTTPFKEHDSLEDSKALERVWNYWQSHPLYCGKKFLYYARLPYNARISEKAFKCFAQMPLAFQNNVTNLVKNYTDIKEEMRHAGITDVYKPPDKKMRTASPSPDRSVNGGDGGGSGGDKAAAGPVLE